jgi:hypothetical protein
VIVERVLAEEVPHAQVLLGAEEAVRDVGDLALSRLWRLDDEARPGR